MVRRDRRDEGCCTCKSMWRGLAALWWNFEQRAPKKVTTDPLSRAADPPLLPRARQTEGSGARARPEVNRRRLVSRVIRRADTAALAQGEGTPSPARLRILRDEVVEDRYLIGEAAGEGASGIVRVITDRQSKQRRVLKSLALKSAKNKAHFEELVNEMEVYLRLDHPNICRLLEVYVEEDACHLIMELCTGRELFERWDGKGHYSELDACVAVSQMLDALQYMHSNNICHRDLKLENWVYADQSVDARLKLIDFGFSKVVTGDAPMTGVLGTVFYIAPEVLEGSYCSKCDVWSTGVIAYMLLTGLPPFGEFEDTDPEIMQKIKRGDPMRMNIPVWDALSTEAKQFVALLLTRDPAQRPSSAEAAQHFWLTEGAKGIHTQAAEINKSVLENMRSFASTNVIKRAACCLIAYSMSVDEADHLEAQFKKLDKERNGTILMHEMVDALKEHLGMDVDQAQALFSRLDLTGDRQLNYSEFLAAACQRRFLAQENLIQEAFRRFDVDRTGFISLDNLRTVLGDEYNGTKVEDILAQVDAKGNGIIEYDEFVRALMDLGNNAPFERSDSDIQLVKKISRAFEFTSLGAMSPSARFRRPASRSYTALQEENDVQSDPENVEDTRAAYTVCRSFSEAAAEAGSGDEGVCTSPARRRSKLGLRGNSKTKSTLSSE